MIWTRKRLHRLKAVRPGKDLMILTVTNPEAWFLENDVIPRDPAYTSGNFAEALIDGATYMTDLYSKLQVMSNGDFVNLTAWRISPAQRLTPDIDASNATVDEFCKLITQGVVVRTLIWQHPVGVSTHGKGNADFVRSINRAGGEAFLDGQLRKRVFLHTTRRS